MCASIFLVSFMCSTVVSLYVKVMSFKAKAMAIFEKIGHLQLKQS